jgi:aminoglycoside 6'-N-acetyltransferase
MTHRVEEALPRAGHRIVLRRLRADDLTAFQAYRHDPAVGRFQGWSPQSDDAASAFFDEMYRIKLLQRGTWTQLAIARREDDGLIGDIGIRIAEDGSEAEIGFTLGRTAQRQGLATEAVTEACALVFERTGARRILAIVDARNLSAIRLVERIGMRRIATADAMFRGEPCVEYTYELPRPQPDTTSTTAPEPGTWSLRRQAARGRHAARFDEAEARAYHASPGLGRLGPEEQDACLADLRGVIELRAGMAVLDVGAGTGALCSALVRVPGIELTALEPSPAMLAILRGLPELATVATVQGSCDEPRDATLFGEARFDVIACRQVVNGLYDPLVAFRHWHRWLKPGGAVVVIEGLYGRDGWRGAWEEEIDVLPLSAVQTMATVPYLLETVGFRIETVQRMAAVNALPSTRTPRYVVVARR